MALQPLTKPYTFRDGHQVVVSEFAWEMSSRRDAIQQQARQEKARLNGRGDAVLLYFREEIYAYLAACSTGDVPDATTALQLPDDDLDGWFFVVRELNPHLFDKDEIESRDVTFRDGSSLRIVPIRYPSSRVRQMRLQTEMAAQVGEDVTFSQYALYPVMAACSRGEVPTFEEARFWPESEIFKWFSAVKEVNPNSFSSPEELAAEQQRVTQDLEKKSRRRRSRS